MYKSKLDISAGAIFLLSALYFFGGLEAISIILLAATVHELGHITAIKLFGGRIKAIRFDASGFCMNVAGLDSAAKEIIALLMGPAFGIAFSYFASYYGNKLYSEYLLSLAGVSLVFSLFNLLPALPLDGGRALFYLISDRKTAEKVLDISGMGVGIALILAGLYFLGSERGAAFLFAGIWILIAQTGIVKNLGML